MHVFFCILKFYFSHFSLSFCIKTQLAGVRLKRGSPPPGSSPLSLSRLEHAGCSLLAGSNVCDEFAPWKGEVLSSVCLCGSKVRKGMRSLSFWAKLGFFFKLEMKVIVHTLSVQPGTFKLTSGVKQSILHCQGRSVVLELLSSLSFNHFDPGVCEWQMEVRKVFQAGSPRCGSAYTPVLTPPPSPSYCQM